jgi:hypothetical protein
MGPEFYAAVEDDGTVLASALSYKDGTLRDRLLSEVLRMLREQRDAAENYHEKYIMTVEGTIMHVRFQSGGWGYRMVRRDSCAASCQIPDSTFAEVCDAAREHAEQCFNGIVWEA